jgi:hypothetical protein
VGVIISTENEKPKIPFDMIVTDSDPDRAVSKAEKILAGDLDVKMLCIGIDPGPRPGVAAVGDGTVLKKAAVQSPEAVREFVVKTVCEYPGSNILIRIGNGDRTKRNRIFNALWDDGYTIEIVDESNTTTCSQTPDEDAAVEIATTLGYRPVKKQRIEPREGEIRDIQRLSRLESNGRLTVSKGLAIRVATGDLSLEKAIEIQGNNGKMLRTDDP